MDMGDKKLNKEIFSLIIYQMKRFFFTKDSFYNVFVLIACPEGRIGLWGTCKNKQQKCRPIRYHSIQIKDFVPFRKQ